MKRWCGILRRAARRKEKQRNERLENGTGDAGKEIRNCHLNVGSGTELHIADLAQIVKKTVGFRGDIKWDASKPDGTPRKLMDVSRLARLGWTYSITLEEGVKGVYSEYCGK